MENVDLPRTVPVMVTSRFTGPDQGPTDGLSLRLSLTPIMEAVGISGVSEFARFILKSRWSVYRMLASGITVWQADEICVRFAGRHPVEVYGMDFYADLLDGPSPFPAAA